MLHRAGRAQASTAGFGFGLMCLSAKASSVAASSILQTKDRLATLLVAFLGARESASRLILCCCCCCHGLSSSSSVFPLLHAARLQSDWTYSSSQFFAKML
eukprot:scaffold230710_cov16-Prasinocladus_malaysianus.AAC.1